MAPRVTRTLALLAACIGLTAGACDPTEPAPTGECAAPLAASARFSVDVDGWPASGDDLKIAAACTVGEAGPRVTLACEDGEQTRTLTLELSATPALEMPLRSGDAVEFELRRKAEAGPDVGFWAIRDAAGAVRLAGAHSFASVPAGDPEFFAPVDLAVDFEVCDERKTDRCRLEQRLVLELADPDGGEPTRVPHGGAATLPSGHQILVERAILSQASGDPKVCPLDESTPETYRYLIAAPAN